MNNKILSDDDFNKFVDKEITFESEKEGEVKMTVQQAVRWGLLVDALECISEQYEERGLDFDELIFIDKVRPKKAILNYINERYIAAVNDFNIEENN